MAFPGSSCLFVSCSATSWDGQYRIVLWPFTGFLFLPPASLAYASGRLATVAVVAAVAVVLDWGPFVPAISS